MVNNNNVEKKFKSIPNVVNSPLFILSIILAAVSLVMSLVEDIIGREKMEKLYFQGNLYGLVEELKKYSSEKEIRLFIRNVDFYNNLSISSRYLYFYKDELMTSLNEIGSYLFKVFYNGNTKTKKGGIYVEVKNKHKV